MTITPTDLRRRWGQDLVTMPAQALDGFTVGRAARETLTTVGVPGAVGHLFSAARPGPVRRRGGREPYLRFGKAWHDMADACVAPDGVRVVALVVDERHDEETFVNSDVPRLLEFLYLVDEFWDRHRDFWARHRDGEEAGYPTAAERLYQRLVTADPDALREGGWWVGPLDEIRDGVL